MVDTGVSAPGPRKPQPLEVHHQRGGSGFIGPASPTSPFDQGDVMPGRLPTLVEGAGHGQLTSEDIGGAQQSHRELYNLLGNINLCRLVLAPLWKLAVIKGREGILFRPAYRWLLSSSALGDTSAELKVAYRLLRGSLLLMQGPDWEDVWLLFLITNQPEQ